MPCASYLHGAATASPLDEADTVIDDDFGLKEEATQASEDLAKETVEEPRIAREDAPGPSPLI